MTNGTAGGTRLVADINPDPGDSNPLGFVATGQGQAIFRADDGVHGSELWETNDTAKGTHLVADINPGSGSSVPNDFVPLFPAGEGSDGHGLHEEALGGSDLNPFG